MNQEPIKTDFDDNSFELNYNDAKERFPQIIEFFQLIYEYQDAPLMFVPTAAGSQVYPGVRYKQNDVATDWGGSWSHIADKFRVVDHTLRELLMFYGEQIKAGTIQPDEGEFTPPEKNYYSTGNPYYDFYVNTVFYWRNYNSQLTNTSRDYLLKYEPIFKKAMAKFTEVNGENFEKITKVRAGKDLVAKSFSTMTGNDFLSLLDIYLERNNLQIVKKD